MLNRRSLGILGPNPGRSQRLGGWVSFNHAPTIWGSYNVSSVTDDGTGLYTVTWARALTATTYAVVGSVRSNADDGGKQVGIQPGTVPSLTSVQLVTGTNNSAGAADVHEICLAALEPL